MTQHPLQFDPNRKNNDTDSLSDTWSQADTLLEELPRARQRNDARQPDAQAQSTHHRVEQDSADSSHGNGEIDHAGERPVNASDRPLQGLLRRS